MSYSPTGLDPITTGLTGWNYIVDSNFERINDLMGKFEDLWNDTAQSGDFLWFSGGKWVRLAQEAVSRKLRRNVQEVSADYSATVDDEVILVDASGGAVTVTLPTAESGKEIAVKKVDGSGNGVTVSGQIDGDTSVVLASQWDYVRVVGNGTQWYKVG